MPLEKPNLDEVRLKTGAKVVSKSEECSVWRGSGYRRRSGQKKWFEAKKSFSNAAEQNSPAPGRRRRQPVFWPFQLFAICRILSANRHIHPGHNRSHFRFSRMGTRLFLLYYNGHPFWPKDRTPHRGWRRRCSGSRSEGRDHSAKSPKSPLNRSSNMISDGEQVEARFANNTTVKSKPQSKFWR